MTKVHTHEEQLHYVGHDHADKSIAKLRATKQDCSLLCFLKALSVCALFTVTECKNNQYATWSLGYSCVHLPLGMSCLGEISGCFVTA